MKKQFLFVFLSLIILMVFATMHKLAAETKRYVSDDVLDKILTTLEELKVDKKYSKSVSKTNDLSQIDEKLDRIIAEQEQINAKLHKILFRL